MTGQKLDAEALRMMEEISLALGREELLGQLSEECCELGQAAQKVRRAMKGTTPVRLEDAREKLTEEAGDVLLLLGFLENNSLLTLEEARNIAGSKLVRWYGRTVGRG